MDKKTSELISYTPALDADLLPIVDTANSTTKKITWANVKATLKTYFDTLYQSVLGLTSNVSGTGFTITGGATPKTLTVPLDATVSGTNTGDQTNITGNAATATNVSGGTEGQILYQSGANTTAKLNKGTAGQILSMNIGETAPEWTNLTGEMPQTLTSGTSATIFSNQYSDIINVSTNESKNFIINPINAIPQRRDSASDFTGADTANSVVIIGNYVYVLVEENSTTPDTFKVFRYSKSNLAGGGTEMTFAGAKVLVQSDSALLMTSDGTNFYFSFEAGNSDSSFILAKYTISGTTLTYNSSITCGSTAITNFAVLASGEIFAKSTNNLLQFASNGTLTATHKTLLSSNGIPVNIKNRIYIGETALSLTYF